MTGTFDRALVDATVGRVVGRRSEIELVVAALGSGRHMLLEGPPGTGKSTLLRTLADNAGTDMVFVEGNAELTPARLAGHFDPARVMAEGYSRDIFVPGPLVSAMETGALLYVEEINRVPEETLNLLITVMSEGEITVPRFGTVVADPAFRFVAAMNPFDAVGTARISGAVYDRVCRVAMGYQSEDDEIDIVGRDTNGLNSALGRRAVSVVRETRDHKDIRVGSSVRGAIDLVMLAAELAQLRGVTVGNKEGMDAVGLDAARAALSGRIRVHESSQRTPESIIDELWRASDPQTVDFEFEPGESGKG